MKFRPPENFSDMFADLPDAGGDAAHAAQEEASLTKAPEEAFDYDPRPSARARKAASGSAEVCATGRQNACGADRPAIGVAANYGTTRKT